MTEPGYAGGSITLPEGAFEAETLTPAYEQIDISGLDPAEVLATLYNNASINGMTFVENQGMIPFYLAKEKTTNDFDGALTVADAQEILDIAGERPIKEICGRWLRCRFTEDTLFIASIDYLDNFAVSPWQLIAELKKSASPGGRG